MNILILGAGQVGSTVAKYLVQENHDVTIVDNNNAKLSKISDSLDLNTVFGNATDLNVLVNAGIEDADLMIAVMSQDEHNIVACQIAQNMFQTEVKIARIRNRSIVANNRIQKIFNKHDTVIDTILKPEELVTNQLCSILRYHGTLQVVNFEDGLLKIVATRVSKDSVLNAMELRHFRKHFPREHCRIATIYRNGESIMPTASTRLEVGDEVFSLVIGDQVRTVLPLLIGSDIRTKRVMIAGAGNIGFELAQRIEKYYQIKIIEMDYDRCMFLKENLNSSVILNGSAHDLNLLKQENIEKTDVFISTLDKDADNIMASLMAKRSGVKKVVAILSQPAHLEVFEQKYIDLIITSTQESTSNILAYIRGGDTVQAHSLRHDAAEIIEIVAHGESGNSQLIGKAIRDIKLPQGAGIGAVIRYNKEGQKQVLIATTETIIQDLDRLVVFTIDTASRGYIEKLFQAPISLF